MVTVRLRNPQTPSVISIRLRQCYSLITSCALIEKQSINSTPTTLYLFDRCGALHVYAQISVHCAESDPCSTESCMVFALLVKSKCTHGKFATPSNQDLNRRRFRLG